MNTTQKRNFKNWREFIDALPFELQSNIRKFVLWEQRMEQRGKRNYLNKTDFIRSVIMCKECKEYIGNKTIKNHKLKYRTIYQKKEILKKNPKTDDKEGFICNNCVECSPNGLKSLWYYIY
jgi:hypothetical protein